MEESVSIRNSLSRQYLLAGLMLLVCASTAHANQEFHLSNEFSETYNDVSGPGSSQSSLTKGWRYLDVFGVNGSGDLGSGWTHSYNLGLKATDDLKNDIKHVSLTNLNVKFSNKTHTVNLGDTFDSFSQYTLNSALKGASYKYSQDGAFLSEVTLLTGMLYPRWDNAFSIGLGRVSILDRLVWGARTKMDLFDNFAIGLNAVGTRDLGNVLPTEQGFEKSRTYALDFEYKPLPGLSLRGEAAFGQAEEWAGTAGVTHAGSAFKFEAVGDQDPSRVSLEYEHVSPDFMTLTGSTTADREKAKAKWRYKATKNITTNLGFLWFHDNLNDQKAEGTTHYYKPEAGVIFKNVLGRKYSVVDLSYKLDHAELSGTTAKSDNIVNANYRDRFWLIDTDANFGFISYHTLKPAVSRRNEFTGNATVSSRVSFEQIIVAPTVYLGIWRSNDEMAATNDQIYEYSAGMSIDLPSINVNSSIKGGQNRLLKSNGDDSAKVFANAAVYWRPKQLESFSQTTLYARYALNDFAVKDDSSRDYRENSLTLGLNFMF